MTGRQGLYNPPMNRPPLRAIVVWGLIAALLLACLWLVAWAPLLLDRGRELWGAVIALVAVGVGLMLADRRRPPSPPAQPASPPAAPGPAAAADPAGAVDALSPREREILALLARGLSNKELARALSLSENTIKTHLANLYAKLGVGRRTQALVVAQRLGIGSGTGDHPQITRPGDGRR
jgi:DNA-binding CsgD family transcriptional regulator